MGFRVRLKINFFFPRIKCMFSFLYMLILFSVEKMLWLLFEHTRSDMFFYIKQFLELYSRGIIRKSKRISNPGCYATSSQLLLAPLVNHLKPGTLPTVFGISGYSGAGSIVSKDATGKAVTLPKVSAESLMGGVKPYALTGHIHEREAGHHLSRLLEDETIKVSFIPSVAPWFSGIISTVSIPLSGKLTAKDVVRMFEEKYAGEKLVKIKKEVPELKDVEGYQGWVVGGFQTTADGDRVVMVVCLIVMVAMMVRKAQCYE